MCVVSMVSDDFNKRYREQFTPHYPFLPNEPIGQPLRQAVPQISRLEFDALKKEMEALKKLLQAANEYDKETGQPDCHMDDKVKLIKQLADLVGVDLKGIFHD